MTSATKRIFGAPPPDFRAAILAQEEDFVRFAIVQQRCKLSDHGKPLVLVLDDEALITLDLEVALCESGFTVAVAASCDEATRFLQDQTPDAAILDVRLREGECVGVAETLVARDVPFVVLTGTHEVDLHGAFRAGKLVPKPADAHGIVALVRSMVSGSHPN